MDRTRQRVLLVDDDPDMLAICDNALSRGGYETTCVATGEEAVAEVRRHPFPAAVVDLVLPDVGGLDVVSAIRQADPEAVVIIITGFASLDSAIEAVRRGVYDYLRKPFDTEELARVLARGLEHRQVIRENRQLVTKLNRLNQDLRESTTRLEDEMRIATEELSVFIDLERRLYEADDYRVTAQCILDAAMKLTGAGSGSVLAVDQSLGRLQPLVAQGISNDELTARNLLIGKDVLGEVAASGTGRFINDLLADPQLSEDSLVYAGIRSVIAQPVMEKELVVGVIALFDKPEGVFTHKNLDLLAVLAAQVSDVLAGMITHPFYQRQVKPAGSDEFIDLTNLVR